MLFSFRRRSGREVSRRYTQRYLVRKRYCRSLLALCCVTLVGELACKESTAPDANATLFNRVRGTYEVSVVLDTQTYTGCLPPSSSNPAPTCYNTTVAISGRRMHGFVTLADTVAASTFTTSSRDMFFQVPAGTLNAINCDTCSSSAIPYPGDAIAIVSRDSTTFEVALEPAGFLILQGQIANDEITGSALSATYLGALPHYYYTGTFVAQRQP
jgi:hypothetical protein